MAAGRKNEEVRAGRLKTLIHFHSDYSYDSNISLETLLEFAKRENFGCLALTDHDTIEGALRLRSMTDDIRIIVGEEVSSRDGDVIGLFIEEHVRPGMSAIDTAKAIRDQGGLVLLPHPFVKAFGVGVGNVAWQMLDLVDLVEVNNGQNLISWPDRKARLFAEETGITPYVGADSHMTLSIAPCYQYVRDFTGPADFLDALKTAELVPGTHTWAYFAITAYRIARHVAKLQPPSCYGVNSDRNARPLRAVPAS